MWQFSSLQTWALIVMLFLQLNFMKYFLRVEINERYLYQIQVVPFDINNLIQTASYAGLCPGPL